MNEDIIIECYEKDYDDYAEINDVPGNKSKLRVKLNTSSATAHLPPTPGPSVLETSQATAHLPPTPSPSVSETSQATNVSLSQEDLPQSRYKVGYS